ncbi:MAG: PKD domain-containing protein, partial [Planctomycetes bacterium]|nr:PKD domain-containing protein [Planctomycetota bacterium]
GTVPLTVHFSVPKVYGGIPTYTYSWDLDGDEVEDDTAENPTMVYTEAGTYHVTLTMTDSAGTEATDTITITVQGAPAVTASANPVTGSAPLEVSLSCSATDPDGSIVLYEWDFDGDGTYDWNSTTTCSTTHSYATNGTYLATIRGVRTESTKDEFSVQIKSIHYIQGS